MLGSRSESAFPSRGGSPPPVEVPFGLPWWRTKLSNTQPCRWCPFPPSTLTSANNQTTTFYNPFYSSLKASERPLLHLDDQ